MPPRLRRPVLGGSATRECARLDLFRQARAWCEALGKPFSRDSWRAASAAAIRVREALAPAAARGHEPELLRATDQGVDSRVVWSRLLGEDDAPLRAAGVESQVRAFLAVQDSTGDVERALGDHAAFLQHHVGAHEGGWQCPRPATC